MTKIKSTGMLLVVLSLLLNASICLAQDAPQGSFENWLEKYEAYDRLEKEITSKSQENTPESILRRAKVYLQLGKPFKTLEIVEMTPSFDDNATESMRLWYGGQAQRAIGDLPKAVLWFTQAAAHMQDKGRMRDLFKSEPDLDLVWMDVWRQMYWTYTANYTMSRRAQLEVIDEILDTGLAVWSESFWKTAQQVYQFESTGNGTLLPPAAKEKVEKDEAGNPVPFISDEDRNAMARGLAAASLEDFEKAEQEIESIRKPAVRQFWAALVKFIQSGERPDDLEIYEKDNYLKAKAFWAGHILAPFSADRQEWLLGLGDAGAGAWTQFRNKALAMPVNEAQAVIDKELGSLLISERTINLLQSFKFAFTLMNNDMTSAATIWEQVDKRALPVPLQVAGLIAFGGNPSRVMPASPARAFKLSPVLTALCGAAGKNLRSGVEAPFWAEISASGLRSASRDWPLDRLVVLAYWQNELNKKPRESLAKRAAFLFNDTSFGINSLFYLADQAIARKDMAMSQFYLHRLNPEELDAADKSRWYEVKTRMELAFGKQEKALETYQELVSVGQPVPAFTRLRMALLMQQRGELLKARDQLLQLWQEKASLTPAMQAEILFWLGEGEQAMRNTDQALDYYLRLAWQYPEQNIWALTAMYRASMIYEKRGIYETAKRLLNTVIKNASTKEQREAAKARLSAINAKTGKNSESSEGAVEYPY
ncbi:tetratricopeptide repeat protein [Salidesulfovibrio onnuriiensis]|uniref:tetratricopeptide repeat protein n=1 Tax=Salidesulfovibrio onnuriiensis TaxID=2583823 RepID=UPI00202B33A6|nr:tetratricopeptide repeat protein [Salidesulfovibrio onnuriiensis]